MKNFKKLLLVLGFFSISAKERVAHLKGWYSTDSKELAEQLGQMDTVAGKRYKADVQGVKAIIVPHAGYRYSGSVAAAAFRLLNPSSIKRVIILAPSHRISFEGVAVIDSDKYRVPNGVIRLDTKVIKELLSKKIVKPAALIKPKNPFDVEHSIEIELPLIAHYLPDAKVIPLLIGGDLNINQAKIVAHNLKPYIDQNTVIVVSSDFTHHGSRFNYQPFKDSVPEQIKRLDDQVLQTVLHPSVSKFHAIIGKTKATVCGRFPIMILLALLENKIITQVAPYLVAYATSADGDKETKNSISYASVVFAKPKKTKTTYLTGYEKNALLKLARAAIENKFTKKYDQEKLFPIITPAFKQTNGAFITIYSPGKKLRGCIGSITTSEPLYKTIYRRAQDAAFNDHRFLPLKKSELDRVKLKVSVLTDPTAIEKYQSIELGKHGIILKKNEKMAVFLPEVPIEQKWNLETTLKHLSLKAGLSADAFKTGATFKVFESIDFHE
jgi:AmmeMemoRadiSam system protein B/AmmeMemoRadiSam system protein A